MILLICICLIFCFWLYLFYKYPKYCEERSNLPIGQITLLIAFKDEEKNLKLLLKALEDQERVISSEIEILFINDHSKDNSVEIIKQWIEHSPYQGCILHLEKGYGKKEAIKLGVDKANYQTLLFTDADCEPNTHWIYEMFQKFERNQADLLVGTVWYGNKKNVFTKLQQVEFAVLQAITAVSVSARLPFMCNGANLMTKKSIYRMYLKNTVDEGIVSGDDVFYLDYLIRNKLKISYGNSTRAIVETQGEETLKGFINQRLRWSSKVKYYKNLKMIFPSAFFSLWSMGILPIVGVTIWCSFELGLLLLGVKYSIDYVLIKRFYLVYNRSFRLLDFFILSLIYPIYVFYIGILSFFKTFTWKNRLAKV